MNGDKTTRADYTPRQHAENIAHWRHAAEVHAELLGQYREGATQHMASRFQVTPAGGWQEEEGWAETPRGEVPSLNWRCRFTNGYEVTFQSAPGTFLITQDGKVIDTLLTRY